MKHPVYYLPAMHRKSAPEAVPAGVLFFAEIFENAVSHGNGAHAFPFGPAEGRALVRDMLAMGDSLGPGGNLRGVFAVDARRESIYKIDAAEEADILAFTRSGGAACKGPDPEAPVRNDEELAAALENAQKVLLLAGAREEAVRDALGLEEQFRGASDALAQCLGEGAEEEESLPDPLQWAQAGASSAHEDDWRTLFEAAFAFMPQDALVLTGDGAVIQDLAERALLEEAPAGFDADFAGLCDGLFPRPFSRSAHGAMYLELPGWRITGRTALPADKPWLAQSRALAVFAIPACAANEL